VKAGELQQDGTYQDETFNKIVNDKLLNYIEISRKFTKELEKKNET
jgi:hypothetical protein